MPKVIISGEEPVVIDVEKGQNLQKLIEDKSKLSEWVSLGEGKPTVRVSQILRIIPMKEDRKEIPKNQYDPATFLKIEKEIQKIKDQNPDLNSIQRNLIWLENNNAVKIYNLEKCVYAVYGDNYRIISEVYKQYSEFKARMSFGKRKGVEQLATLVPNTF